MFLMKDILGTGGVGGPRSHPQNGWGEVGVGGCWFDSTTRNTLQTCGANIRVLDPRLQFNRKQKGSKFTPPQNKTQNKKFNH